MVGKEKNAIVDFILQLGGTLWVGWKKNLGRTYLVLKCYFVGGGEKKVAGKRGALHAPLAYPTPPNLAGHIIG